jgi:hypothetical protein
VNFSNTRNHQKYKEIRLNELIALGADGAVYLAFVKKFTPKFGFFRHARCAALLRFPCGISFEIESQFSFYLVFQRLIVFSIDFFFGVEFAIHLNLDLILIFVPFSATAVPKTHMC